MSFEMTIPTWEAMVYAPESIKVEDRADWRMTATVAAAYLVPENEVMRVLAFIERAFVYPSLRVLFLRIVLQRFPHSATSIAHGASL